jgi:hypothetical protein
MICFALRRRALPALAFALPLLGFGATAQDTRVLTLPAPPAAQESGPALRPADTPRTAGVRGLMWKATSATNTVYLVGSLHFGTPDMYPLPDAFESAFQNSSALVVEIDMNKVGPSEAFRFLAANGMYTEGDTLWKHVSVRTRELLTRFCEARGFSIAVLSQLKPWAASLTMSTLLMQSAGFQSELGIDMHFLKQAAGSKRVEQLETLEQQLRMLSEGSPAEQERSLVEAAGNPEQATELAARLKSAWIGGDAKAMDALMAAAFEKSPDSGKRLLGDRNPHMAAEVVRYLRGSEPYFVVVGAGHLVGSDGIVSTLRRKGFTVTQVLSSN